MKAASKLKPRNKEKYHEKKQYSHLKSGQDQKLESNNSMEEEIDILPQLTKI